MSVYTQADNKLVTCPYDEAHKVKASRLQLHIAKCKLNHLELIKETCPFNATHLFDRGERDFHLLNCPDRAPLDRRVSQNALDKNNPFKGRTALPTFSDSVVVHDEESWDDDGISCFVPKEAPVGAIIEPRPMAKPAERRQLYRDLHKLPLETEKDKTSSPSTKLSSVPRQPKQPSETQRLQSAQQQHNIQAVQNLGLGRGRPSRIAANIFSDNERPVSGQPQAPSFSSVVQDMSNLGMGRGQQPVTQGSYPVFRNDDDDFPALGCGRGALHASKQSLRTPGVKPQK